MGRRLAAWVVGFLVILGLALPAFAGTVTIEFTQVNPHDGVYGGFYAGIYEGTVNGKSAQFICDDFLTDINNKQTWSAYANTNSPLTTGSTGVK